MSCRKSVYRAAQTLFIQLTLTSPLQRDFISNYLTAICREMWNKYGARGTAVKRRVSVLRSGPGVSVSAENRDACINKEPAQTVTPRTMRHGLFTQPVDAVPRPPALVLMFRVRGYDVNSGFFPLDLPPTFRHTDFGVRTSAKRRRTV